MPHHTISEEIENLSHLGQFFSDFYITVDTIHTKPKNPRKLIHLLHGSPSYEVRYFSLIEASIKSLPGFLARSKIEIYHMQHLLDNVNKIKLETDLRERIHEGVVISLNNTMNKADQACLLVYDILAAYSSLNNSEESSFEIRHLSVAPLQKLYYLKKIDFEHISEDIKFLLKANKGA